MADMTRPEVAAASLQGEAKGQGEDELPDRAEAGAAVEWLRDRLDMDENASPARVARHAEFCHRKLIAAAALRAVAPVGNVDPDMIDRHRLIAAASRRYRQQYPNERSVPIAAMAIGIDVALAALRGGEAS